MNERHFRAPWSLTLKVMSVAASLILAAASLAIALHSEPPAPVKALLGGVVFLTLAVSALFTVRGYALGHDALYIKRLFWWTRIRLAGLRSIVVDRDACRRSIRLCGNGGLFAFAGWFRNRKLGKFRLCATDLKRTVVLHFPDRTWVTSPENPEEFVRQVKSMARLPANPPDRFP